MSILVEYLPPQITDLEQLITTNHIFKDICEFYRNMQQKEIGPNELATNELDRLLRQLEGLPNFKALYEGLSKILNNSVLVDNYGLPYSIKRVKCNNELLILTLKLIRINPVNFCKIIAFH